MTYFIVGVDPASRKTGVALVRWPDCTIDSLHVLHSKEKSAGDRIVDLQQQLDSLLLTTWRDRLSIVASIIERPDDAFGRNRHTTAFVLGRAFQALLTTLRQYTANKAFSCECAPSESSAALGLARNASKATRIAAAKQYFAQPTAEGDDDAWDAAAACVRLIAILKEEHYAV